MFNNHRKRNERMSLVGYDPALSSLGVLFFMSMRMAKIRFGMGISEMSGKSNGVVYARNASGFYVRNMVNPVNPNSARQVIVRSRMTECSQAWAGLTPAQRSSWSDYASNVKIMDRFGVPINVTGFAQFTRSNMAAKEAGIATQISDGPSEFYLGEKDDTVAVTISEAAQQLSITFDNTKAWAGEVGGKLLVYQGVPQNPSRQFFDGPFKLAGTIAGAVVPPVSPAVVACSSPCVENQKVWVQFRTLRADGRLSEPFRCSCVVGA